VWRRNDRLACRKPAVLALVSDLGSHFVVTSKENGIFGHVRHLAQFDNHKMSPSHQLEHLPLLSGSASTLRLSCRYCQRAMGDTLGIVVYKKVTQEMNRGGNEQLV
jgi:hypothetical protein